MCLGALFSIMHVVTAFSLLGRMIVSSSAMGPTPILPKGEEERLSQTGVSDVIFAEAEIGRRLKVPITHQYLSNVEEGSETSYRTSLKRRYPGIILKNSAEDRKQDDEEEIGTEAKYRQDISRV